MPSKPIIQSAQAQTMLAAAHAAARDNNLSMSIAIVDDGGYPLCLLRMDGAGLLTPDVARAKARTAALMRAPSRILADRLPNEPALLRLTEYLPMPGGFPIIIDGHCVGGIGISGGTSEQDELVGTAGLAALSS